MGSEKHAMFHKVKKILSGKNDKARDMASVLDDVMKGKPIEGIDTKKEAVPEPVPVTEEEVKVVYKDNPEVKDAVVSIQARLAERERDREREQ